jgi:hypothetical protein
VSDPSEAHGSSITAREILDKASSDIDTGLSKDPELQAQMMNVMGNVYDNLGLYPQAESLLTRAVDTRRHVLGPKNNDTLASSNDLGWVLQEQGHYADAEKLVGATLGTSRHVLGPENAITQTSMHRLAWIYYKEGRYAETEKLDRETLDIRRRVLGPEHPRTLAAIHNLAVVFDWQGNYGEAEKLYREVLDIERRVLGPEHPEAALSTDDLACILVLAGKRGEALSLLREAVDHWTPSLCRSLHPGRYGSPIASRRPALRRPCCPRQIARRRSREEVKQWREGNFLSVGKRVAEHEELPGARAFRPRQLRLGIFELLSLGAKVFATVVSASDPWLRSGVPLRRPWDDEFHGHTMHDSSRMGRSLTAGIFHPFLLPTFHL